MAKIVELRQMSDDKLREKLEDAREEMFNLRFRQAAARLEDVSRLKKVRREVAQMETVLHTRQLAVEAAAGQPEIAAALNGKEWHGRARFDYEESAWTVEFSEEDGDLLATAHVNLNKKRRQGRRERENKPPRQVVTRYEVEG